MDSWQTTAFLPLKQCVDSLQLFMALTCFFSAWTEQTDFKDDVLSTFLNLSESQLDLYHEAHFPTISFHVAKNWHHHLAFSGVIEAVSPFTLDENEIDQLPMLPLWGHRQLPVCPLVILWWGWRVWPDASQKVPVGVWWEGVNDLWLAFQHLPCVHIHTTHFALRWF